MWGDIGQTLPWLLFHHMRAILKEGVEVLTHDRGSPKGAPGDQPTIFFKLHPRLKGGVSPPMQVFVSLVLVL